MSQLRRLPVKNTRKLIRSRSFLIILFGINFYQKLNLPSFTKVETSFFIGKMFFLIFLTCDAFDFSTKINF